ncbi:hypothetical protein [Bacillus sp. AK031]
MIKDAWWLARKELFFHKIPLGFSVLVTIFFAVMTSFSLEQSIENVAYPETAEDQFFFIDFVFVLITPGLAAIFMSGPYLSFRSMKEDPFSKRMAFLRSLPIPVHVLSLSRTIMMIITLFILSLAFYTTITIALHDQLFDYLTLKEYLTFIGMWLGYAAAIGGFNPYIEYGTNGKVLHSVPYVLIVLIIFLSFLFYKVVKQGIVESTILLSMNQGWPIASLFLIIGIAGIVLWNILLTKRLARRDYV